MVYKNEPTLISDIINIWNIIVWRMNVHHITPQQLAKLTHYSIVQIIKGTKGETAIITDDFLRNCVKIFNPFSGRIDPNNPEDIYCKLTRKQCVDLLKPEPAMPVGGKNFWETGSEFDD